MEDKKTWSELLEESLPRNPVLHEKLKAWHLNLDQQAKVIHYNLSKFKNLKGQRLLDFGCGESGIAVYFAKQGLETWATDMQEPPLYRTRVRAEENGVEVKTFKLNERGIAEGVEDHQFDIIICHEVIEHSSAPGITISEWKRLVKKDGLIYVTSPNRLGPRWFFSDPHYQLPLVSALPKRAADYLVRKLRLVENDVVRLYNPWLLGRMFVKSGLEIVYSYPDEVREKLTKPQRIVSPTKKKIFSILNWFGLTALIIFILPLLHLFSESLIFILKPAD